MHEHDKCLGLNVTPTRALLLSLPLAAFTAVNVLRWHLARGAARTFAHARRTSALAEAKNLLSIVSAGAAAAGDEEDAVSGSHGHKLLIYLNTLAPGGGAPCYVRLAWLKEQDCDCSRVFMLYTTLCEVLGHSVESKASCDVHHRQEVGVKNGAGATSAGFGDGEKSSESLSDEPRLLHVDVWNTLCALMNATLAAQEESTESFANARAIVAMWNVLRRRYPIQRYYKCAIYQTPLTTPIDKPRYEELCPRAATVEAHLLHSARDLLRQNASVFRGCAAFLRTLACVCSVAQVITVIALSAVPMEALVLFFPSLEYPAQSTNGSILQQMSETPAGVDFRAFAKRVLLGSPGRLIAVGTAVDTVMELANSIKSAITKKILADFRATITADTYMAVARADYVRERENNLWETAQSALGEVTSADESDIEWVVYKLTGYAKEASVFLIFPVEVAVGWVTVQYVRYTIYEWYRLMFYRELAQIAVKLAAESGADKKLSSSSNDSEHLYDVSMSGHSHRTEAHSEVDAELESSDEMTTSSGEVSSPRTHVVRTEAIRYGLRDIRLGGWADSLGTTCDALAGDKSGSSDATGNSASTGQRTCKAAQWLGSTASSIADGATSAFYDGVGYVLLSLSDLGVSLAMLSASALYPSKLHTLTATEASTVSGDLSSAAETCPLYKDYSGTEHRIEFENGELVSPACYDERYHESEVYSGLAASLNTLSNIQGHKPVIDCLHWLECAPLAPGPWLVEFCDVSFRYPGSLHLAVSKVSFRVEAGTFLGIIGFSGVGKTTLLLLLSRVYAPTSGSILVNGLPIERYPARELRRRIMNVWQDGDNMRFAGELSIEGNVALGNLLDANDGLITSALRAAEAWDFVESRGRGRKGHMNTNELSGGEIERLNIARGLMKPSGAVGVCLFDECASAMDSITESRIMMRMAESTSQSGMPQPTRVMVSHRLSSIRSADEIVVLKEGTIVERGTWLELERNRGNANFHKLLSSQQLDPATHE